MAKECMLSTIDNPYNPFEEFASWLRFDKDCGYNCCERLDRIAQVFDDMSEIEVDEEVERAIDEIIKYDFLGVYVKVTPETVFPLH
jgi:hypothetical protein